MDPLIFTDKTTGFYGGIKAKDRRQFIADVNAFHKHFVVEGGWIDTETLANKVKPLWAVRWIANIVKAIGYKFFNKYPTTDLEKIKCGMSSYMSANAEWIAKDKSELDEDLVIKIFEINKAIGQKANHSFLGRTFNQNFTSPSTWPWIIALSQIARIAGMDETAGCPEDVFTKLGWDFSRLKV